MYTFKMVFYMWEVSKMCIIPSLVIEWTWRLLTCKKTNLKVYYQGVFWLAKRYSCKSFVVGWLLIGNIILAILLYCIELVLEIIVLVCQCYCNNDILDMSSIGGIHLENCVLAKTVLVSRVNLSHMPHICQLLWLFIQVL